MEETLNNNSNKKLAVGGVVVVLVLAGVAWRMGWLPGQSSADTYQAVFLTNNQVYFGKLSDKDDQYPVLTDIYYLRVTQPLQPSQPNPNVNLVKLGDELHGPADRMEINRDQILFIEDLKPDSQVVRAINDYRAANPK
ncbi:MAG: hypothetical protein Q7S73_01865 [bacterium]|nr:hypothetical protein [bacterium]